MRVMIGIVIQRNVIEIPVGCTSGDKMVKALKDMKTGKPSKLSTELVANSEEEGIQVMVDIRHGSEWNGNASCMSTKYNGPIFKGKGDMK